MVQRTRDHLLDGRNTDRFAVTLALDRHGLAVLFGDQVDAVVTDRGGESDLPARAAQAGGDVALKLHPLMPSIAVMPARGRSRRSNSAKSTPKMAPAKPNQTLRPMTPTMSPK